jgi:hypothetical protein
MLRGLDGRARSPSCGLEAGRGFFAGGLVGKRAFRRRGVGGRL